ncbi:MAG: acyltransferase [Thermoplasmata archaeon]|nr:acyltransferase [Thermoplasmata archaeon]
MLSGGLSLSSAALLLKIVISSVLLPDMEESEAGSRLSLVDIFKGVVITLVVLTHVLFAMNGDSESPVIFQCLFLGLFGFMLLSGYFYRPGRGFVANMKKRFFQLAVALTVCTVVITALSYVWCVVWGQNVDSDDFVNALSLGMALNKSFVPLDSGVTWSGCMNCIGYYYIWAMLVAFVVFYALADHVIDDWKRSIAALAVLVVAACALRELYPYGLPFYAHISLAAASFMMAGAMAAKVRLIERVQDFRWGSWRFWALFLGSLAAGIILVAIFPPGTKITRAYYGEYGGYSFLSYFVEVLLINTAYLCMAAIVVKVRPVTRLLSSIGRHTFGILLFHGFVVAFLTIPFFTFGPDDWLPAELISSDKVLIFFATMVICMAICVYGPVLLERIRAAIGRGRSAE